MRKSYLFFSSLLLSAFTSAAAFATVAKPWQLNFQEPSSPVMEKLVHLHDQLLVIISVITAAVLLVVAYVCIRFRRKANPVPATFIHNNKVETTGALLATVVLIFIGWQSVPLHYYMERDYVPEMTLKITGRQWYWNYQYPDHGGFDFDSYMLSDADAEKAGKPRLLGTDNRLVVPVDTNIRVQLTAADVIHAFALPAMGVKRDAVPGRLNETWFNAKHEGIFYGQCSELCGKGHGFMPIELEVVSKEKFAEWVAAKKKDAGIVDAAAITKTSATPVKK